MAHLENNKPKTEKTSASVISTLPRLCPTTKLDTKEPSSDTPEQRSPSPENRSVTNANRQHSGHIVQTKTNLYKSKLTDFKKSDRGRFTSNSSLVLISPRNYHGQIPVLHRHSLNLLRMSPPETRSPSPIKKSLPKEKSNRVKTITLNQDTKTKSKTSSRSPSPGKTRGSYKQKSKPTRGSSPPTVNHRNSERPAVSRRTDASKQVTSPRMNSPPKRKSKTKVLSSSNVDFSGKSAEKSLQRQKGDLSAVVLKQTSQPSLCKKEKIIQPQEKISLDHLKNQVYTGDHKRLSFEKVHLCIEKSVENLSLGESKRSYLVTYSSEDLKKQEEISLSFLQNLSSSSVQTFSTENEKKRSCDSKSAIRTLSGHELILTPSMKLDFEKTEMECDDDIEISELLHETGENFDESHEVHILQDDANEYDSEVSTDGELTKKQRHPGIRVSGSKCSDRKSPNSLWKSREADLLNDVDYRQSVYHPAVSRRQKDHEPDKDFRPKSKSIEDNYGYTGKVPQRINRSHSSTLRNKYTSPNFTNQNNNNERSWAPSFDKTDGNYSSVNPVYGNLEGTKRIRTKNERISGALLRFTLKIIRLLAIFNLWPGDNCHMLTSQSLKCAR